MNLFAIFALINLITSIILGALVILNDWRSSINRSFAIFAFSISCWSYGYFIWQISTDADNSLLWLHVLMAATIFIAPVYFYFVTCVLEITKKQRPILIAGVVFAVFYSIINWIPGLFIAGVRTIDSFGFWPIPGMLFLPFLAIWFFFASYAEYLLVCGIRSSKDNTLKHAQLIAILVGTSIGYIGGLTNFFLWFGIPVPPYANVLVSVYVIFVTYAIMQHRLFNMKVIATELLVFSLWVFIFIRIMLSDNTLDQLPNVGLLAVSLIIGVFLIRSVDREVEQRHTIESQRNELAEINVRQETLLYFVSHEVKVYLTKSMYAFASITEGDFGAVSPQLKEISSQALGEMREGMTTVLDILGAASLKRGTITYNKQPFDLKETVASIIRQQKSMADNKHLALDFMAGEGNFTIVGDQEKIAQHVLRNIIDNAIKYTPSGDIHIDLVRKENVIRFSVRDSGIGITPEDMARLFTEGGKGKESTKINVHSTGYGLFVAKTVCDAHGAKVWAESRGAGTGARFVVEFPLT